MATFQTQLEDIVGGSSVDTTAMSDWLTAGARKILDVLSPTKLQRIVSSAAFTNTVDVEGKKVISVSRKDSSNSDLFMPCRLIAPNQRGRVLDSNYMEYATRSDPAYLIDGDVLEIFPDTEASSDGRLDYINSAITVAYSASSIDNFPDEAEKAVVLYAARNYLQRLMTDVINNTDIPDALTAMTAAVEAAEAAIDKMNAADESVWADEDTFTTASSQLTRVKTALDSAHDLMNNNQPSTTTDVYGAQANEDTELVGSALAIIQTELQRAQAHLAEWVSIGDMRIKEVNASLAEAQGYGAEIQARLADDQAKYNWYVQQYQMIDGQYKEEIQILKGSV